MLKILVIGDPHFKVSNVNQTTLMAKNIIHVALTTKPDLIVVLGDTLDRHELIDMIPLLHAVDFLHQLQDIAPLYVLIGNHDRKNNQDFLSSTHPFTALKYWNNTHIVDECLLLYKNNVKITFVPYVPTGRFQEALETVDWKNSHVIFCHQEFKDAQMGALKSTQGDEWPTDYPYIISGHIHDYQTLQNNILYIGTPIQHKFGENAHKFIALFHLSNKMYTHDNINYEKIKLNCPIKKIIHLTTDQLNKFILDDDIEAKIIIHCEPTDIKLLIKHPKILELSKTNAQIIYKNNPPKNNIIKNEVILNHHEPFIDLLHQQIKNHHNLITLYNEIFN